MPTILSLRLPKGKSILRGNDHFWSVIMERHRAGQAFTLRDIDAASNAYSDTIRDYIRRLRMAGLIEQVGGAVSMWDTEYRPLVIQSEAPRVRRDGSVIESQPAIQCMWNLMRGPTGRAGFTYLDLVHWSQTDETRITQKTAKAYIRMLLNAAYLIVVSPAKSGTAGAPAVYRLDPKMNTGPKAPKILHTKMVFDPNRQEILGLAEAEEVQP